MLWPKPRKTSAKLAENSFWPWASRRQGPQKTREVRPLLYKGVLSGVFPGQDARTGPAGQTSAEVCLQCRLSTSEHLPGQDTGCAGWGAGDLPQAGKEPPRGLETAATGAHTRRGVVVCTISQSRHASAQKQGNYPGPNASWTPPVKSENVSRSVGLTPCDPWPVASQAPLSKGFPRLEYWSGLPFPSPGDLPDPGMEPVSPALQVDFLPSELPGKTWTPPNRA